MKQNILFFVAAVLATAAVFFAAPSGAGQEKDPLEIPYATAKNFRAEVLESPVPVLLQFHADWCPYCRAIQPTLQALYQTRSRDELRIFKVDVDASPEIASRFDVESIPTLVVMNGWTEVERTKKVLKGEKLLDWVRSAEKKIENAEKERESPAPVIGG